MVIVCEGENRTGKSTLAKKLVSEHGFTLVKCSAPKKGADVYVEYMKKLKKIKGNVVFDRFAYGELVYGPIYRGYSQLDKKKLRDIELTLMEHDAILIYCFDTVKNIARRFVEDNETFAKVELIPKTLKLFEKVVSKARIPVIRHQIKVKDLTKGNRLANLINVYGKTKHK